MRAIAALLLLLLISSFVQAATPNQLAEAEARSYLVVCHDKVAAKKIECLEGQQVFIEYYLYAKCGDKEAMGTIAAAFSSIRDGSETSLAANKLGIRQDAVQACAWRILRASLGRDPRWADAAISYCGTLLPPEHSIAYLRAADLGKVLQTTPAQCPAWDWEPSIPGLAHSPPHGPLDSTAVPLHP